MPSGVRKKLRCLVFGLGGLVLGVAGAETTFGRLRADAGAALLFSLELRDEAGAPLTRVRASFAFSIQRASRSAADIKERGFILSFGLRVSP